MRKRKITNALITTSSPNNQLPSLSLKDGEYLSYGFTHIKVSNGEASAIDDVVIYVDRNGLVLAEDTTEKGELLLKVLRKQFKQIQDHDLL